MRVFRQKSRLNGIWLLNYDTVHLTVVLATVYGLWIILGLQVILCHTRGPVSRSNSKKVGPVSVLRLAQ